MSVIGMMTRRSTLPIALLVKLSHEVNPAGLKSSSAMMSKSQSESA